MQKNLRISLIAAAVAAALPVPALADVTVYGRANVSVDYLDDGADYAEPNISSNSSRLGFKSELETSSGVIGFMQIEGEISYNEGQGTNVASRDTFVGVKKANFGSLRLGKFDTPFKSARGPANLFGDQLGDMRNLTRVGNGRFDERAPSTIHYQTPTWAGVAVNLAYSMQKASERPAEDPVAGVDPGDEQAVSISVTYKGGPVEAALAYESWDAQADTRGEREAVRLAASWKVIDPLKLVAIAQTIDHDNDVNDADVFGLGAEYSINKSWAVKGMYMARMAEPDDSDSDMLTLGVEHKFDSKLRVYANYSLVNNDDNAKLTPWSQARSADPAGANGETASGVSLGLRFDF